MAMFSRRTVDEAPGAGHRELLADVALNQRRGRGGQRDGRRRPEPWHPLAEHTVVRSEIVAPVGDAVRLVHGDQRGRAAGEQLREARNAQPLGSDEQEVETSGEVAPAGLLRFGPGPARVDPLRAQALRLELRHLVLHQRAQRADHESRAAPRDARKLVAERLARAGRRHQQDVASLRHRATHGFLPGAEALETEDVAEQLAEPLGRDWPAARRGTRLGAGAGASVPAWEL